MINNGREILFGIKLTDGRTGRADASICSPVAGGYPAVANRCRWKVRFTKWIINKKSIVWSQFNVLLVPVRLMKRIFFVAYHRFIAGNTAGRNNLFTVRECGLSSIIVHHAI